MRTAIPDRKRYQQVAELIPDSASEGLSAGVAVTSESIIPERIRAEVLQLTAKRPMGAEIAEHIRQRFKWVADAEAVVARTLSELITAGLVTAFEAADEDLIAHVREDLVGLWSLSDEAMADGRTEEAHAIYRNMLPRKLLTVLDYLFTGLALQRLGRLTDAIHRLAEGHRKYPENQQIRDNLITLAVAGDEIELLLRTIPTDRRMLIGNILASPHRTHRTQLETYKSLLKLGDLQAARDVADSARKEPNALHSVWLMADAATHQGVQEEADSIYRWIIARKASSSDEYLLTGLAYHRLHMTEQAIDLLNEGRRIYPDTPSLMSHLVFVCITSGRIHDLLASRQSDETEKAFIASLMSNLVQGNLAEVFAVYNKQFILSLGYKLFKMMMPLFAAALASNLPERKKRELILFFIQYSDSDRALSRSVSRVFKTGVAHDDFRLEVIRRLTPPFIPEARINAVRVHLKFIKYCRKLMEDALELDDPIGDFTQNVSPWHALFCLSAPQHYASTMAAYESLSKRVWPQLDFRAPHIDTPPRAEGHKIKVGFMAHPGMPMMSGLMARLDRNRFETVYLGPGKPDNSYTATTWQERGDEAIFYDDTNMRSAIQTIAEQKLDILLSAPSQPAVFYPTMAKLAALHMVVLEPNWTDGFPASDYYISWKPAEPVQSGKFYHSKVAYLDHPPYWIDDRYDFQVNMTEEERLDFLKALVGAEPGDRVYLCPSTPPKLHPRMDSIILGILKRDPKALLVFLRSEFPPARNLMLRWKKRLGKRFKRIRFVETLERSNAHRLLHAADCTIDSYPIGGMSSSFDGAILGIPTATFPADIPFGRWLSSIYHHIGVSGLTAKSQDEYVELAVKLATDRAWRKQKSLEIKSKSQVFVESESSAASVQEFLLAAWDRHCAGLPPANWISDRWAS